MKELKRKEIPMFSKNEEKLINENTIDRDLKKLKL